MRRYAPLKPSRGTVIPTPMRLQVLQRDQRKAGGCVGFLRFAVDCAGPLEVDHVRASHGMGMKSVTCPCNLVSLCGSCHRYKTEHGKDARPVLLRYLEQFNYGEHTEGHLETDCGHVDPVFGCCERTYA